MFGGNSMFALFQVLNLPAFSSISTGLPFALSTGHQ